MVLLTRKFSPLAIFKSAMDATDNNLVLEFSSKAKTLEDLSLAIKSARVLPLYRFTVGSYLDDPEGIVSRIIGKMEGKNLIIRSSVLNEDTTDSSNAGRFMSITDVEGNDHQKISRTISEVISSYNSDNPENEIFVQPALSNISLCGVAFTCDIDTLAPYYTINYEESGKNDVITGGKEGSYKTYIQLKDSPYPCKDGRINKLISTLRELENLYCRNNLDTEFAFNDLDELFIFQVRPVVIKNKENLSSLNLRESLKKVYKKIEKLSGPHPNLLGSKALYGVMPDWNPAEIIGLKPTQLSFSLYKEMVTDSTWAYQRDNYGYRNLRSHPLVISFLGVPFIDIRVDFNSFLPKQLDEETGNKLVDYYLNKLIDSPSYHDKVEFEIVHSCYSFDLENKLEELKHHGFSLAEIKNIESSLLELTNKIISSDNGFFRKDIERIDILTKRYNDIIDSKLNLIDKIYWLIENCKRYGTLPFAGIARAAFIATQMLRSLVGIGIITAEQYNLYLNSFTTVTKRLNKDLLRYSNRELSRDEFLKKYGHLRPGTYDIMSLRYDENFENYFSEMPLTINEDSAFSFSHSQYREIRKILTDNGLDVSVDEFFSFIKESVEGREYSKFIFTQVLSKVLQLIEKLGDRAGVARNDLAFINIKTILNLYASLDHRDLKDIFKSDIAQNKELYQYTKAVKLPSLILDPKEVYGFFLQNEEPNFITLKRIQSRVVLQDNISSNDLKGQIIFIKSADPGYDFLFTKDIGGLVTQFGGANSHMAVRCAELGIPAVIGAGEKNFSEWKNASILEIDCSNKQVRIIR
jgi:phosphohistidine swiveling domain-containing protein